MHDYWLKSAEILDTGKRLKIIHEPTRDYFYSNMLNHFVEMVGTKKEPIPLEEILEIIKVLVLGKKSRRNGSEIKL